MTINTTANRKEYDGNGVTTAFSFPYYFLADADLVVIETVITTGVQTTKTLTTHYTVAGAGNAAGGTVTMLTAPAATVTLTIYRDPAATQGVDLVEGDPLPVETAVERPLDKLTMIVQRVKELIERSLRLPEGDTGFVAADLLLPAKVTRASKYFGFDANGKPIATAGTTDATVHSAFVATLHDDASAPAVMATLHAGLAAETTPAIDDELFLYDLSAATVDKITLANALKVINGLTEDAAPDQVNDYLLEYDVSASTVKKVLQDNLFRSFTKTCAAGYVRVGPNLCMKISATSSISLVRDVLTTITDPDATSKALIIVLSSAAVSAGGALNRFTNITYRSNSIQQGTMENNVYEVGGLGSGLKLLGRDTTVIIVKNTDYQVTLLDDAGNQGTGTYEVRGYYD